MRKFHFILMVFMVTLALGGSPAQGQQYPIVDTGQTTCFGTSGVIPCPAEDEAFFGQDAQYSGTAPAFNDNGAA